MFINLHCHLPSKDDGVFQIVNVFPRESSDGFKRYSVGLHPWYIDKDQLFDDLELVNVQLKDGRCVAIGECGLDKKFGSDFELQKMSFEKQLVMAESVRKPVIIHCVAAYSEIIETKKRLNVTVPMIIHGFRKNFETAVQLLNHGLYLSFGSHLLTDSKLQEVFARVDVDRIFLETDHSDVTIAEVYLKAADLKNMTLSDMKQIIESNFETCFTKKIKLK